jgi:ATP-dependent Lon protease
LRTGVLFPGTVITLPVGRKRSVALVESLHSGDVIGTVTQKDHKVSDPDRDDLYDIGTFVRVVDIARMPGGEYRISLEAQGRFALTSLSADGNFWLAEGTAIEEQNGDTQDARLLADSLRERVQELAGSSGGALAQVALSAAEPGLFADQVASTLGLGTEKELSVLREIDVPARLRLVA